MLHNNCHSKTLTNVNKALCQQHQISLRYKVFTIQKQHELMLNLKYKTTFNRSRSRSTKENAVPESCTSAQNMSKCYFPPLCTHIVVHVCIDKVHFLKNSTTEVMWRRKTLSASPIKLNML